MPVCLNSFVALLDGYCMEFSTCMFLMVTQRASPPRDTVTVNPGGPQERGATKGGMRVGLRRKS